MRRMVEFSSEERKEGRWKMTHEVAAACNGTESVGSKEGKKGEKSRRTGQSSHLILLAGITVKKVMSWHAPNARE